MHVNGFIGQVGALRRKLRALTSVAEDAGATAPEKANAEALKKRLEQRLREAEAPAEDWTNNAFRLGQVGKGNAEIRIAGLTQRRLDGQRPPARQSGSPGL